MIDCYNDPYQEKYLSRVKRKEFDKLKKSSSFLLWKDRQYKIQEGKCAYCKIPLHYKHIITHVDHVTPLRFEGKNQFSNLVLSCRRCNSRKWIANNYTVPGWIKENDRKDRARQRRSIFIRKQRRLLTQLKDELIMDELRWIQ